MEDYQQAHEMTVDEITTLQNDNVIKPTKIQRPYF
jgi:hypothetical protein